MFQWPVQITLDREVYDSWVTRIGAFRQLISCSFHFVFSIFFTFLSTGIVFTILCFYLFQFCFCNFLWLPQCVLRGWCGVLLHIPARKIGGIVEKWGKYREMLAGKIGKEFVEDIEKKFIDDDMGKVYCILSTYLPQLYRDSKWSNKTN